MKKNWTRMVSVVIAFVLLFAPVFSVGMTNTAYAQGEANLALGKTVTASSSLENGDWGVSKVVDGNYSSGVSSMGYTSQNTLNSNHTEWIKVDLGAASTINKVTLFPRDDNGSKGEGFPADFTIQLSEDNSNWTTVVTKTNGINPGTAPQTYYFSPSSARYVKINATSLIQNLTNPWKEWRLQFAEVGIYNILNAPAPVIATQPQGKIVVPNTETLLSVAATASGTLSYQWYSNSTNSTNGAVAINNATSASINVPTSTEGVNYYYCEVTNTDNNMTTTNTAKVTSDIVAVRVATNALPPEITVLTQPQSRTVYENAYASISVEATATGTLSYQWYSNTTNSTSGAVAINNATGASIQVPTTTVGTMYYYCEVTNTDNNMPLVKSAKAASGIVAINVLPAGEEIGQDINVTRAMKYGLFVHYVPKLTVDKSGVVIDDPDILANNFDAYQFAEDIAAMKVKYVIFTAWHLNMVTLWPSDAMKSWLPTGHTTKRDVLGDMITAVKAKGISVMFYTHPRDGHDFNATDQALSGWNVNGSFNKVMWNNFLNDVYGELMTRYGSKIDGIYFDEGGNNLNYIDYVRLRKTIKDINPNVLLFQNNYYGNIYSTDIGDQEFFFWAPFEKGTDGTQWTSFNRSVGPTFAGNWWAEQADTKDVITWSPESMFRYTVLQAGTNTDGLGIQWAAGPYAGGGFEKNVVATMSTVGNYIAPIEESINNTFPSTSYPTAAKSTIAGLQWGVATRSTDDAYEYIHVLKAPNTKQLTLPAPKDGKLFGNATLLSNGHAVALDQNVDGVTLTLDSADSWNSNDTVIKLTVVGKGSNLALGKLVYASSSVDSDVDRWGMQKITDGIYESIKGTSMGHSSSMFLTTESHTEYVIVDTGTENTVSTVTLFPRSDSGNEGEGFPVDFTIQLSTDNTNWTTVTTATAFANPGKVAQTFNFSVMNARYVKVEATKLKINTKDFNQYRLQLAEIGVYNTSLPSISLQPQNKSVNIDDTVKLSVAGTASGTLSYQWYSNNTNSTTGALPIADATGTSIEVSTSTAGTTYYYCVVTNTENNMTTGTKVHSATSAIATVIVKAADTGGGDTGGGDTGTGGGDTGTGGGDTGTGGGDTGTGGKVDSGNVTLTVKPDSNGISAVTMSSDDMKAAIDSAKGNTVTITVKPSDGTKTVEVTVPLTSIEMSKAKGVGTFVIDSGLAAVSINLDMLKNAAGSAATSLQLSISDVDPTTLPLAVQQKLGSNKVYEFDLSVDGNKISKFNGSSDVQVEVGYTLKQGEDPNQVVVYFIDENGELDVVKNGQYNPETGKVVFKPKHFSKYAIAYADVSFDDMATHAWAKSGVEGLAARGVIDGIGNGQFNPNGKVTRAEFIKMLLNTFDLADSTATTSFSDVQASAWYYGPVASAQKLGIVAGKQDGSFGVNESISRQDAAVMIYRGALLVKANLGTAAVDKFTDNVKISDYAVEAVTALHNAGLINGASGGEFMPLDNMTRAESAVIIYNLFHEGK